LQHDLIALRKRLRDDFPFYAKHSLQIRTKQGEIAPFKINEGQRMMQEAIDNDLKTRGYVRIICLKGRQIGMSTFIGGYMYFSVSQRKAAKAMVVAHMADSTRALFDMTKRMYENTPEILKPSTKYSSRRELFFDKLDSAYVVATAGGESIGRGETLTHIHASELAFWPKSNAAETWNGLIQSVPNTKGTCVFIESTANGVSGLFHDIWKGAVEGTNGFTPVFVPWFIAPEYRLPCVDPLDYTPEEERLREKFGLDDEQLMFRRHRIAQTSFELFQQEFPAEPDEAFLTTGRPVFNPQILTNRLQETQEIVARLALEENGWVNHPRGELLQYYHHDPAETYYIGADTAMGGGKGDYSVAQILDSKKRQVAIWRSNFYNPDYFAEMLSHLGRFYNDAFIIPENNAHGILTCSRLAKDFAYPNLYMVTEVNKLTDRENTQIGFTTNVKTKPLIIDQLRASVRDGELELNDKTTIREMLAYIVTETGQLEAEPGCHDDCVMALALVNHVHLGRFKPVEVTDDYYLEVV
jgi:hypothetical protein